MKHLMQPRDLKQILPLLKAIPSKIIQPVLFETVLKTRVLQLDRVHYINT